MLVANSSASLEFPANTSQARSAPALSSRPPPSEKWMASQMQSTFPETPSTLRNLLRCETSSTSALQSSTLAPRLSRCLTARRNRLQCVESKPVAFSERLGLMCSFLCTMSLGDISRRMGTSFLRFSRRKEFRNMFHGLSQVFERLFLQRDTENSLS